MFKIEQLENESEKEYQKRKDSFLKEIKTFGEENTRGGYLEINSEKSMHYIISLHTCNEEDIKNENSYLYGHGNGYMRRYKDIIKHGDIIRQEGNAGYFLEPVPREEYNKQKWVPYDIVEKYKLKWYVYPDQK